MSTTTAPSLSLSPAALAAEQRRADKAALLAGTAHRWLKCWTKEGTRFFAVPSSTDANHYHLVNQRICSCPDFQKRGRPCKHLQAVQIHCQRVRAERAATTPAPTTITAPAPSGVPAATPRPTASADLYTRIFGTDDGL